MHNLYDWCNFTEENVFLFAFRRLLIGGALKA